MSLNIAARIARRELRGGIHGFRIFLACLALGVAAIAAVGSVRVSIEDGLTREGATILGGDAEMQFSFRLASDEERDWMASKADVVSEILDFRSMAVVDQDRTLTQVKGVDGLYPIYGAVVLEPEIPLEAALADNGAVMHPTLMTRLGLEVGDTFKLGVKEFEIRAALIREPDDAGGGFSLGPRTIVRTAALEGTGLLSAGSIFDSDYRMKLPEGTNLEALKTEAEGLYRDSGLRWRDSRNGAPSIQRFVDRIGSFLVLVGLAGLAVGGVGVSAAVRAYLDGKTEVIATLKTVGAEGRTIFQVYFMQIGVLTLVGVAIGLALGAAIPIFLAPLIQAQLPVPVALGVHAAPLAEAALYGILTAALFTLWPLARAQDIRAAALFRGAGGPQRRLPRLVYIIVTLILLAALVGLATWFSGVAMLALWSAAGILASLLTLLLAAFLVKSGSRALAKSKLLRGRTALRLAFGSVGGPGGEATSVLLSLGLGLTVLAAIGQIDTNLRSSIEEDLPAIAPSFFFIDIQNDQLPAFLDRVENDDAVSRVDTAPSLRGILTRINGQPAREVAGNHWVVQGDRGITYSALPTKNAIVTKGEWWPEDYDGPPLLSFAEIEADEIGVKIGDEITINILGRDITATITNLRGVDFSDASINFVMTLNPSALDGAPHTHIATVYADKEAEAAILRDVVATSPNITAVSVREAVERVAEALKSIAAATSYGAGATLLTGFVVLIGAAAAGERARTFEAAVLKTIGANRRTILGSFALRSAILGAAAGLVAILAGAIAGWAVMTFVMEGDYSFEPVSAFAIVLGGACATLAAGLAFAWRPLASRPAQILRGRE